MSNTRRALFIGGASRSGTTMLGAWLSRHKNCITTPESQFKTDLILLPEPVARKESQHILTNHFRLQLWGLDKVPIWRDDSSFADYVYSIVDAYAKNNRCAQWDLWIDHTPSNLKYSLRLQEKFPSSKFVHLVRDGRGVANSVINLSWGPNNIIEAASWWAEQVCMGLAAEIMLSRNTIRVKYEDLVDQNADSLRCLLDFANIASLDHTSEKAPFTVPRYTQHQHKFVGMAPDAKIATAWKESLGPRDIEIFEFLTGDLLAMLGYSLVFEGKARPPKRHERWLRGMLPDLRPAALYNKYLHLFRKLKAFR